MMDDYSLSMSPIIVLSLIYLHVDLVYGHGTPQDEDSSGEHASHPTDPKHTGKGTWGSDAAAFQHDFTIIKLYFWHLVSLWDEWSQFEIFSSCTDRLYVSL